MIEYKIGDLFKSLPSDKRVMICHITNDLHCWGAGFVVHLGRHFPKAQDAYHKHPCILGQAQIVEAAPDVYVANMCAQQGLISKDNPTPIKYPALKSCLEQVAEFCQNLTKDKELAVISPAFGSGLAGGKWSEIEPLLKSILLPVCNSMQIFTLNEKEQAALFAKSSD